MLLIFDIFFLVRAVVGNNFVPIVPILAGVCITGGLLFLIFAEQESRKQDYKEHRRLSRVAHQLESPIKSLEEDLAYLSSRANKLPAEERLKIKRMETKTKILLANVRDIFLMLQAQGGTISKEKQVVDICKVVEDAIGKTKAFATAKNVEVLHKAHCTDAPVRADKSLLIIALVHLIENGITYTLTPGLVNIAVIRGRNAVRIIVQDRGIGIKEADKEAVFQAFMRGDKAQQYDTDGIGVGLTLSRLIVQECGGQLIWRQRKPQLGSEFEIKLPLAVKG